MARPVCISTSSAPRRSGRTFGNATFMNCPGTKRMFVGSTFLAALLTLVAGCGRSIDRQLIGAAGTGKVAEIRRLVSIGANVNCVDGSLARWTPLHWAVYEDQQEAVAELLAAGADPNVGDGQGRAPLTFARQPGIVAALVLAGARTEALNLDSYPTNDPLRSAMDEAVRTRQHAAAAAQRTNASAARTR